MSNLSIAARRRLAAEGKAAPPTTRYKITDPTHRPDLNGEFGGVKVDSAGVDQYVYLTDEQAKFYLASGSIERVNTGEPTDGQQG